MTALRFDRKDLEGRAGAAALDHFRRRLVRLSPERAEAAGARWGAALFRLSRRHRERALANLALAFPEMTPDARRALARRVFEHYGRVTADFLTIGARPPETFEAGMAVEGMEHLDAALAQGKGVLLITGHFGNWERMSRWVSARGYPLSVVARDTRNERMNEILRDLRSGNGTRVIPRGAAARPIIERLRKNELVGILPDQNADEVFVPFFGHPAGTVLGPGVLAERTGAPVLTMWCVWTGPARYRMVCEPPLTPFPDKAVKGEGMIWAIHKRLERIVRAHPEQWLWFHDRWRSARRAGLVEWPPGAPRLR